MKTKPKFKKPGSPKAAPGSGPARSFLSFQAASDELARLEDDNAKLRAELSKLRANGGKVTRPALKRATGDAAPRTAPTSAAAQYQAIKDPTEKTRFWEENRAAIVADR